MSAPPRRFLAGAGAVCFTSYLLLGSFVAHAPLCALDRAGQTLIGHGVAPAVALTSLGSFPVYAALCAALLLWGAQRKTFLPTALMSTGMLLVAWCASDWFKTVFARARMEHWIVFHESSYSYASGHATLSLVFYGTWLWRILRDDAKMPLAARRGLALGFALLILGIGWSRLALGAHYVTDVIGGYLLGAALLCAASALHRPMLGPGMCMGGGGGAAAGAAPPPAGALLAGGEFTMD